MMRALGPESRLVEGLGNFTDAVVVNVLFVLTCLPVLTAGASLAAAHGTLLEVAREEGSRPAATYFRYLLRSWKTASGFWLLMLLVFSLLIWEYQIIGGMGGGAVGFAAQALVVTGLLLVSMIGVWAFPLASQGHAFKDMVRFALQISIRRLPVTIVVLALHLLPVIAILSWPHMLGMISFAMLVIGFAFIIYVTDLIIVRWLPRAPQR